MVARQFTAATHFLGQFAYKTSGHGRAMLAPTRVFYSFARARPAESLPCKGEVVERSDDRRGFCRFAFTPNSCSGPR